jgi:hypothetical protein
MCPGAVRSRKREPSSQLIPSRAYRKAMLGPLRAGRDLWLCGATTRPNVMHGSLGRNSTLNFLSGGGETGALMGAHDWAATPLGSPEGWPSELKPLVGVMLGSNQPMFIAWGRERTILYNDVYAEILVRKFSCPSLSRPIVGNPPTWTTSPSSWSAAAIRKRHGSALSCCTSPKPSRTFRACCAA